MDASRAVMKKRHWHAAFFLRPELPNTLSLHSAATAAAFLNRRAGNRAVGTIHAAIAGLRLEHGMTLPAFVKPLAAVGRHELGLRVATFGASQRRFQLHGAHCLAPASVDGYPASSVASRKASRLVLASSNVTVAVRLSRLTSVLLTPGTASKAFLTVIGQAAQFMPGTDSVTVCGAAHSSGEARANAAKAANFFMDGPINKTRER